MLDNKSLPVASITKKSSNGCGRLYSLTKLKKTEKGRLKRCTTHSLLKIHTGNVKTSTKSNSGSEKLLFGILLILELFLVFGKIIDISKLNTSIKT